MSHLTGNADLPEIGRLANRDRAGFSPYRAFQEIKNLRSSVSRCAISTLGQLFEQQPVSFWELCSVVRQSAFPCKPPLAPRS